MSTEKTPISAAASSFDNAVTPITPTAPASETSPEKHDVSKDNSDDGNVHELHARPDTATEYQEFLNLHKRYNGSKEWSKVLWKMDVSPQSLVTLRPDRQLFESRDANGL
jgi:hypothetical protein